MNYCIKRVQGQITVEKFNNKELWLNRRWIKLLAGVWFRLCGENAIVWKLDLVKWEKWWKILTFIPENNVAWSRWLDWSDATTRQPDTLKSLVSIWSWCCTKNANDHQTFGQQNTKHPALLSIVPSLAFFFLLKLWMINCSFPELCG